MYTHTKKLYIYKYEKQQPIWGTTIIRNIKKMYWLKMYEII
jgi:hypothetical protein